MKNTLVIGTKHRQPPGAFPCAVSLIAATLSIAALSLAGCKSQQQVQKENAVDLEAQWKALDAQYKQGMLRPLYPPFRQASKDTLQKALSGEPGTKADSEAFDKAAV